MNLFKRLNELMQALKIPKDDNCMSCKFCASSFDKNSNSCLIFEEEIDDFCKLEKCKKVFGSNGNNY